NVISGNAGRGIRIRDQPGDTVPVTGTRVLGNYIGLDATGKHALGNAQDGISVFRDRKSTRLNSSHVSISYAVFCLKKKTDARTGLVKKPELVSGNNYPPAAEFTKHDLLPAPPVPSGLYSLHQPSRRPHSHRPYAQQ